MFVGCLRYIELHLLYINLIAIFCPVPLFYNNNCFDFSFYYMFSVVKSYLILQDLVNFLIKQKDIVST